VLKIARVSWDFCKNFESFLKKKKKKEIGWGGEASR